MQGKGTHARGLLCPIQGETVRHERAQVEPPGRKDLHEAPHPLLATRAERGDDRVVSEAGRQRVQRECQLPGVHLTPRKGADDPPGANRGIDIRRGADDPAGDDRGVDPKPHFRRGADDPTGDDRGVNGING